MNLALSSAAGLDAAIPAASSLRLLRHDGALYADVDDAHAGSFRRALAYGGIRADPIAQLPRPDGLAVPARSGTLVPLPRAVHALDVILIETVALSEATRRAIGHRLLRWLPLDERRRTRCRVVLRGEDHLLAWERRAWIARADLRDPRVRGILRPIVFDREAIVPSRPSRSCRRSDGLFARWATG